MKQQYQQYFLNRLSKIDAWLDNNSEFFNPFILSDKDTMMLHKKSFCEYSLYLYVCDSNDIPSQCKESRESFYTHLNHPDLLPLAKRDPSMFLAFGLPIAIAKSQGKSSSDLDAYFNQNMQTRHAKSQELIPFRMLDYVFAARIFGDDEFIYPLKPLVNLCNYHRLPDPILADESQTYALTHNIFYLTGMREKHDFLKQDTDYNQGVDKVLEALMLKFIAKQDLDVSIELLGSLALTGHLKKWHLDLMIREVEKVIIDDTIIPGPVGRIGDDIKEKHGEKFHVWVKNYHTMLVAAMMFRVILKQLDSVLERDINASEKLIYPCGQMLRLAQEYNLPLLLAVIKSLEDEVPGNNNECFDYILSCSREFVESQRRSDGRVGYFCEGRTDSESIARENSILSSISTIEKSIDWSKFKTFGEI